MGAELAHAVPHIQEAGNAGANGRGEGHGPEPPAPAPGIPLEQNPKHDGHLQDGGDLAHDARPDLHGADDKADDKDADDNQHVAPEDGAGEPQGNLGGSGICRGFGRVMLKKRRKFAGGWG